MGIRGGLRCGVRRWNWACFSLGGWRSVSAGADFVSARVPSEMVIEREMLETGFDRLPSIRRIQQREFLKREAQKRRAVRG